MYKHTKCCVKFKTLIKGTTLQHIRAATHEFRVGLLHAQPSGSLHSINI